jgi:hypothetical protein
MGIVEYYSNYDEKGRMFRTKARSIEYLTTLRKLGPYYGAGSSILEMGAAYGAYTGHFVGKGMRILATDLVPRFVESLGAEFGGRPNFRSMILDANDLSPLGGEGFDLVLCLGPYYHIQERERRLRLLEGLKGHLKDGAALAISYINRNFAFPLYYRLGKPLGRNEIELFEASQFGKLSDFDTFMGYSYFTSPEEIEAEVAEAGYAICEDIGTDGFYGFMSESVELLSEAQFEDFLEHHCRTCGTPSIVGASNHGLVICRAGA